MFKQQERKKPSEDMSRQTRAFKTGRGTGEESDYTAWIQVTRTDFASHGRSEIVGDPVTNRLHHFLSWLEFQIWLFLTHLGALEIKEQFPLERSDLGEDFPGRRLEGAGTLSIAEALGIKHPQIEHKEPRVQSTDLLVSDDLCDRAVFIRHADDVPTQGRQLDLLKLHTVYWRERGISHYVLTEDDIDARLIDLLLWALPGRRSFPQGPSAQFLRFLADCQPWEPLRNELLKWKGKPGLAEAVDQFKAAVFVGLVAVDLPATALTPLSKPWRFYLVNDAAPEMRLARFFATKEAQRA